MPVTSSPGGTFRSAIHARILRTTSSMFRTSPTGGGWSESESRARPTARKCPCASMKPGSSARAPSSTTRVASPRSARISPRVPTAAIVSPRTATASAAGRSGSMVTTCSPRKTTSAGGPPAARTARTPHAARPAAQPRRAATVHFDNRIVRRSLPPGLRMLAWRAGARRFTAISRRRTPAPASGTAPARSPTPCRGARRGRSRDRGRRVRPRRRGAGHGRPGRARPPRRG